MSERERWHRSGDERVDWQPDVGFITQRNRYTRRRWHTKGDARAFELTNSFGAIMYEKGVKLKGYGVGPFQSLTMRVRQDIEPAKLDATQGVILSLSAVHQDGSTNSCVLLLDLEASALSHLITQLHFDLHQKIANLKREHEEELADLLVDALFKTEAIYKEVKLINDRPYLQVKDIKQKLEQSGVDNFMSLFANLFGLADARERIDLSHDEIQILADSLAHAINHELFIKEEIYISIFNSESDISRKLRTRIEYELR